MTQITKIWRQSSSHMIKTPHIQVILMEKFSLASGKEIYSDSLPGLPKDTNPGGSHASNASQCPTCQEKPNRDWNCCVRKMFSPRRQGGRMTHLMLFPSHPTSQTKSLLMCFRNRPIKLFQSGRDGTTIWVFCARMNEQPEKASKTEWLVPVLLCTSFFITLHVIAQLLNISRK